MSISIYLEPIAKGAELVKKLLQEEFGVNDENAQWLYDNRVKKHFDKFKDTTYLLAESSYVDKVYRDSYYQYYSSKLSKYKRDCIRISFFEGEILETDFWEEDKHIELQEKYRGFLVIRPTDPFILGRNIISPKALKTNNFLSCTTKFHTTANGLKFTVEGFPHSSQDNETISCAETTLWAVMEYFSNKYSDYKPVLPSKIIQTLNKVSSERQIPSKGLNIAQMSFALKEFGFGTRIYSREQYNNEFESLLSCYIESGIPIIIAMENRPHGSIGHALLAIGHEKIDDAKIDAITPYVISDIALRTYVAGKNIVIHDYDSIKKDFIFIDDNQPVYQRATLDNPAAHYPADWNNCKVTYFIVPLYTKIYLEAFEAKNYILRFLTTGPEPLTDNSQILLRFFLASSRSFKNEVAMNATIQEDLKGLLLEASMPKFIWVAEISTKDLIKQKKANGMVILDATEANIYFNKPLILAAFQGKLVIFDESSGKLESDLLPLQDFTVFEHNLNAFDI
jgi:hypothetical protein